MAKINFILKAATVAAIIGCMFLAVSCVKKTPKFATTDEILKLTVPENWDTFKISSEMEYEEGRLIVGYESESDLVLFTEKLNAGVITDIPEIRAALVGISGSVEHTLAYLKGIHNEGIRYIKPDYRGEIELNLDSTASQTVGSEPRNSVNDPLYEFQWSHAKINSESAWTKDCNGQGVVVAVFDTGVDASHPDLEGQFVKGWSARTQQEILPGESTDYNGHGTHVAGIIAAKKNNRIGIAGLASMSRIMPIPSLNWTSFETAQAVVWAVGNGAKVLQNSWAFIFGGYDGVLKDAYDYALGKNVAVIFAAANSHTAENWTSPRSWPGIVVVGASDIHDEVTDFSNGSAALSVVAPGKRILSTVNMSNSHAIEDEDPGKYAYYNGTSMAAPHVSALAALLYEKYPYASAYQIRKIIESSAAKIEAPHWSGIYTKHNPWTGYGRIDIEAALNSELPEDNPGNLVVSSVDGQGNPTDSFFYVTLVGVEGLNYWGCTAMTGGECIFSLIDPGVYDVYIGEKPREDGKPPAAFAFYNVEVGKDTRIEAGFPY